MKEVHRKSAEFEACVDKSGKIAVPESVMREFGSRSGTVHVRLTAKAISSGLLERSVSEEEIERISSTQLESREQVVKFLLSEGSLKKRAVLKRMIR